MTLLLDDIAFQPDGDRLRFGNAELRLEFDCSTGRWLSLRSMNLDSDLIDPGPEPALDFRIDGEPKVERHGAAFLGYETGIRRDGKSASLSLHFGVSPLEGKERDTPAYDACEYLLTAIYALYPRSGRLDRSARLVRHAANRFRDARRMEGFHFALPGAAVGDPAECVVNVPGPWFPNTYVRPDTPLTEFAGRRVGFHGAPDGGFGFLTVTNPGRNATLAAWMEIGGEVNYHPSIQETNGRLTLRFRDNRLYRLTEGFAVESDVQRTEFVRGPLPNALAKYRDMVAEAMPPDPKTPDWVREMVLLEVYPAYYPDGFKGITARLPFYREVGFNTLYLMPHWLGGYSPLDLYKVDPKYGTPDDLKAMVKAAHGLGMKVLRSYAVEKGVEGKG